MYGFLNEARGAFSVSSVFDGFLLWPMHTFPRQEPRPSFQIPHRRRQTDKLTAKTPTATKSWLAVTTHPRDSRSSLRLCSIPMWVLMDAYRAVPVRFLLSRYGMCWCVRGSRYFFAKPVVVRMHACINPVSINDKSCRRFPCYSRLVIQFFHN